MDQISASTNPRLDPQGHADLLDPPPKRYRIGELARHTGLTRQTLHNYTRWGLITEAEWTPGGHRLYDESVFTRLSHILRLRRAHTVEQIKTWLDTDTDGHASATDNLIENLPASDPTQDRR